MFSAKQLSEDQVTAIITWAAEGAQLPDIQLRMKEDFGLSLTYMDTRLLVLDLGIELAEAKKDEPVAEVKPAPVPTGFVSVTMDEIAIPGAIVSGKVVFSDGADLIQTLRNEEAEFTIKNTCNADIELRLTPGPNDTIELSQEKIMLKGNSSELVKIRPRGSPIGIYTISVNGKTEGNTNQGIRTGINSLRVLLQPLASDCFYLENYEFNLAELGEDEKTYTTLVNKCVEKNAVVKYDLKIETDVGFGDMVKQALGTSVGGMAGGLVSQASGLFGSDTDARGSMFSMALLKENSDSEEDLGPLDSLFDGGLEEDNPDPKKKKKGIFEDKDWKKSGKEALGSAVGAYGGSYLAGSLLGTDPNMQQGSALGGAIGGGVATLLGGTWIGMAGTFVGSMIGQAVKNGDKISEVTRTVPTTIENYIDVKDVGLSSESPKAMPGGEWANASGYTFADGVEGSIVKQDAMSPLVKGKGENAVAIYPISFTKSNFASKMKSLTFVIDYGKKDVEELSATEAYENANWAKQNNSYQNQESQNLMQNQNTSASQATSSFAPLMVGAPSGSISYQDAQNQSKVDRKDQKKVKAALANSENIKNMYASMNLLFLGVSEEEKKYNLGLANCFTPTGKTGDTGPEAKPKVKFTWEYDDIVEDRACSDGGIYCDASQFMMEVIDRLDKADSSLSKLSTDHQSSSKIFSQENEVMPQYLGVNLVSLEQSEEDYKLSLDLENNTLDSVEGRFNLILMDTEQSKAVKEESFEFDINGQKTDSLEWALGDLAYSRYKVKLNFTEAFYTDSGDAFVKLVPFESEVFGLDADALEGLGKSTANIREWSDDVDDITKELEFKAYIMKDGFTKDFLNDFKKYALEKTFFGDIPKEKVKVLLSENIEFLPETGNLTNPEGFSLQKAGYYNVNIVVNYKNTIDAWDVFNDEALAKDVESVKVYLSLINPSDNPAYYLPLDATVGEEAGVLKRNGYGIDYSGDAMWFNDAEPKLIPTLVSESSPQVHVEIDVSDRDMETLNSSARGRLLRIAPAGTEGGTVVRKISFTPSLPAPIAIQIKKETMGDAYGFYRVVRDNKGPVNTGDSMITWFGFCNGSELGYDVRQKDGEDDFSCEGFRGEDMVDLQGYPDVTATAVDVPTGMYEGHSYGLFFNEDSIIQDGEHKYLSMRGLIYLPKDQSATIEKTVASDEMWFMESSENNTESMELTPLSESIETLEDIYALIEDKKVCVTNVDGSSGMEIWWNPAKAFEELE